MTVYLYMHPLDDVGQRATLRRLNALRALREELSGLAGVLVSATPRSADLEVELVNVVASDEAADVRNRDAGQRILVIRMIRGEQRLDFVCSDGCGELTAERQAARRIRGWVAGEDYVGLTVTAAHAASMRAVA